MRSKTNGFPSFFRISFLFPSVFIHWSDYVCHKRLSFRSFLSQAYIAPRFMPYHSFFALPFVFFRGIDCYNYFLLVSRSERSLAFFFPLLLILLVFVVILIRTMIICASGIRIHPSDVGEKPLSYVKAGLRLWGALMLAQLCFYLLWTF